MGNRKLPFGYQMRMGEIVRNEPEANAVQDIFLQYSLGASLKEIAEQMSKTGPTYDEGKSWNKNMVARILENAKYTGVDNYLKLVDIKLFEAAAEKRQTKQRLPERTPAQKALKRVCSKPPTPEIEQQVTHLLGKLAEQPERITQPERTSAPVHTNAQAELDDILDEVSSVNSRTELSQERLSAVDERLSLLYDLLKSYSASSVSELISKRDALSGSLSDSSALQERKSELESMIEERRRSLEGICKRLHESRKKALAPFSKAITDAVRSLEMEHAGFQVELKDTPLSASGSDSVLFLFSSSGAKLVEVSRCASGGEMSRLMLCLKAMMAKFVNMPTLIFDEIDTGVSGSAADKMGRMICDMGKDMQVFAITHLPQVAAKGSAHYVVEKEYDVLGKATTSVRPLSGQDRVMEIARMLSGSSITAAAIENAKSLLSI